MKKRSLPISFLIALAIFTNTAIPHNVEARVLTNYQADFKATDKKIADAFNKFRYDMTVEWDQKDPYFKEFAQRELENSLRNLKSEGVQMAQYSLSWKKISWINKPAKIMAVFLPH